ncbi:LytR/AlgR family response regulator transcription factor [Ammoniphilus resinae]|uniref:Two-component system LytT family response regulator/two-component system response regulator LytT n=1 Tax=Ammoniphilus resinae TaxID=861532 RepID=A0ABS4GRB8_9BACL|nr:LytTR family DNA-binding domain-containing protein [Ammoniphilus resinae]MBP1932804.1 two-component system LytT family response regulator/two-component system response regulator LytT [Ammoniphilus resinae]
MIRVLIVDDELPAREELLFLLESFPEVEVVGEATHGEEALEQVHEAAPDVLFLDIDMFDMSGLKVASELKKFPTPPLVIFSTAYREYALNAFELDAIDYVTKPYQQERIGKALGKVELLLNKKESKMIRQVQKMIQKLTNNQTNRKIIGEKDGKLIPLSPKDILFLEADGKKTMLYTKYAVYTTKYNLNEWEEVHGDYSFYRTHRSYIVNINQIEEVIPWFNYTMKLKIEGCPHEIPVSRSYVKGLKEMLSY